MNHALMLFAPVVLFLGALLFIAFRLERVHALEHYFVARRNLSGFFLAASMVATYGSVSSFVSGPGLAWHFGLSWVAFAAPQIMAGFFMFGLLGKKLALIGHRTGAITIVDVIGRRFASRALARALALVMLAAFVTMSAGQLIGGARLFAAAVDLPYGVGLTLFALVTLYYTSLGGWKAVVITDVLCALLMLAGMGLLYAEILHLGGGLAPLLENLQRSDPSLMSFNAGGALPLGLLFSAWVLVGFGTAALPQSGVRCLTFSQSAALKRALVLSTVLCGALMIGMTLSGALARGVIDLPLEVMGGTTDHVIPYLIAHHMHPLVAGLTLLGPLAATLSTVSALLLGAAGNLARDVWPESSRGPRSASTARFATLACGAAALALAAFPNDVVAWINLNAFGALEVAFAAPLLGGLFWRRATRAGAVASLAVGLAVYVSAVQKWLVFGTLHAVVPGLVAGIVAFVLVSLVTKPRSDAELVDFFRPRRA